MTEIILNNKESILSEFKVERVYQWNEDTRKNDLVHKTFISITNISKETANDIKNQLKGDNPTKGFGRFDFDGDVNFNINDFYITLYNVSLSNWSYQVSRGVGQLKINFTPLDGFGYLSGMGLNVLRNQKLSQVLGI